MLGGIIPAETSAFHSIKPLEHAQAGRLALGSLVLCIALRLLQPAAAATLQPLLIDPARSHVDIAAKATIGSFVAKLGQYVAIIAVDPEKRCIKQLTFQFHCSAVKTGNAARDQDILDWEQATEFPDVSFVLTALEKGVGGQFQARGALAFHGHSREIAFPVAIRQDDNHYSIDGEAPLDTRNFGLPIIRIFWLLTVNPVVHVRFHLQGNLGGRP